MTGVVERVVGERAEGERELVRIARIADQRLDEVAGPDVVSQVGEQMTAEGVVPEVLDEGPPYAYERASRMRGAEPAESLPQQSGDPMVPGRVNGTQVCDHRVRGERPRTRESTAERKRANDRAGPVAWQESGVS